jgi:hypothetical protein
VHAFAPKTVCDDRGYGHAPPGLDVGHTETGSAILLDLYHEQGESALARDLRAFTDRQRTGLSDVIPDLPVGVVPSIAGPSRGRKPRAWVLKRAPTGPFGLWLDECMVP